MSRISVPFAEALAACGLSHVEASTYLECKVPRLRKWTSGAINPPEWAMDRIALLFTIVEGDFEAETPLPEGAETRRRTIADLRSRVAVQV